MTIQLLLKDAFIPAFMPMPGPTEWVIILIVVLIIFGPKKLPDLGKSIGQGIKELRKATETKDVSKTEDESTSN